MKSTSIEHSKRIVIKIGSSLLISENKFNSKWLRSFIGDVIYLKEKKIEIIIVASGSVSLGKNYLNIQEDMATNKLPTKKNFISNLGNILDMN